MTNAHKSPMYPALSVMEKRLPPLRYGREPYWRAPVAPPARTEQVLIPSWTWRPPYADGVDAELVTLDVNGAFLGAMGSVVIAHGPLKHTGEYDYLPTPSMVPPGYYKVTVPYWGRSGIVHPLGDSALLQTESSVWVAHPTVIQMLELLEEGTIGDFGIIDSWTCATTTNFRAWVGRLKTVRTNCLTQVEDAHPDGPPAADCECAPCDRYSAFKEGYSAALSMMLTGQKCGTHRPDWAHAVYAQHAASSWRKAWRYVLTGKVLVGMGATDEITVVRQELAEVLNLPKLPFRVDNTGRSLGAFKEKAKPTPVPDHRPAALVDIEPEDIL